MLLRIIRSGYFRTFEQIFEASYFRTSVVFMLRLYSAECGSQYEKSPDSRFARLREAAPACAKRFGGGRSAEAGGNDVIPSDAAIMDGIGKWNAEIPQ